MSDEIKIVLISILVWPMALILSFIKSYIDDEPNQPTVLGVRGIPTMILFKDGKQVSTQVGAVPKSSIISWIKKSI